MTCLRLDPSFLHSLLFHFTSAARFNMSSVEVADSSDVAVGGSNKRRKVTRACDRCKARKRRCDGAQPCSLCITSQKRCCYETPYKRGRTLRVTDLNATQTLNDQQEMHHRSDNLSADDLVNDEVSANGVSRTSRAGSPFGDDAQLGQYSGPTSTFSVGALSRRSLM